MVIQLASLAANQQIRTDRPGFETIKSGKPKIMFSLVEKIISVDPDFKKAERDRIDKLLNNFLEQGTYKHRTETEINEYFEAFETVILGSLPPKMFGARPESVFSMMKKSNRVLPKRGVDIITLESGEKISIEKYFDRKRAELRDKIKAGKVKFGKEFTGPGAKYQDGKS